ncbi:MAG: hypothetical protein LDL07_00105 [Desulfarculus sp.]|nr:hypothetical protein [Desulfarculus sp.]
MKRAAAIDKPLQRLVLAWLAALFLCPAPVVAASLHLWAGEPARAVLTLKSEPAQTFQLEHRNSIYDAPVRETYRLGPAGRLVQVELESPSAGVFEYYGFDPPQTGKVSLDREVSVIRLRSTSYQDHLLRVGGRTIRLQDLAQPGQVLGLEVTEP